MTDVISALVEMRGGQVVSDINQKFNEMLQGVLETGRKGELVIKLIVQPSKFAMGGAVVEVEAEHECKVKKPELSVGKATFFITKDGSMSREHPEQLAMYEETIEKESNG